jgi:tRNA pseudouridine32 synthase/23S rRNA pseudouridine746 synthase
MMLADTILFIDAEAIIIDKPSGLPVDPPRDGSLSIHNHLDSMRFGFRRVPHAVHRLDRDTSGCLLLARNPKALKRFGAAFEAGLVEKIYLAVLNGVPEENEGMIDLPLAKISSREEGWRMVVDPKGKSARTGWTKLGVREGRALIAFRPETGRTHQLRVHAVEGLGFAISGDPVYGDGVGPMMLHASGLSLPREGKDAIAATAPIPDRFIDAGFGPDVTGAAVGTPTVGTPEIIAETDNG